MSASPASPAAGGGLPLGRLAALGRRVGIVAVTLLGLLTLTFAIGRVMPLDPVLSIVGSDADAALRDGPIDPGRAVYIVTETAEALTVAVSFSVPADSFLRSSLVPSPAGPIRSSATFELPVD